MIRISFLGSSESCAQNGMCRYQKTGLPVVSLVQSIATRYREVPAAIRNHHLSIYDFEVDPHSSIGP